MKKLEIEKGVDRMIKIYDTMTRSLREFVPIEEGKVRMYVCGPTVCSYPCRQCPLSSSFYLSVAIEYRGFEVNYISTSIDVDDKIIHRAKKKAHYASAEVATSISPFVKT